MIGSTCQYLAASLIHEGVTYERFCGETHVSRYVDGGFYCPAHAPSVVLHGTVSPSPDPAMTANALAHKPGQRYVERMYGTQHEPSELDVREVRVVKAHTDAVKSVMDQAAAIITASGMDEFAKVMAGAVISARDFGDFPCIIGMRPAGGGYPLMFGPYTNIEAAQKAIDAGWIITDEGAEAYVFPLGPAPRATKKKASK
jgi:hypothetical protein